MLALVPTPAAAQRIITTAAGTDWYLVADGKQAKDVPLSTEVLRIAVDGQGNTYIADGLNHAILKVGRDGITRVVAGNGIAAFSGDGGPATSASLFVPSAVTVDAAGNLYIADGGNFRIRKVTPDGMISTIAGSGVFGFSGDGGPALAAAFGTIACLTLDGSGNLLVCDASNSRVRKVTPAGIVTTVAGSAKSGYAGDNGPAIAASLNDPEAVVLDVNGRLYIADFGNNVVRVVGTDGAISTFAGNTSYAFSGDGGPARAASMASPAGLAFDPAGNLYVSDSNNFCIRAISPAGIINTIAGNGVPDFAGDGGPPLRASFYFPFGLAWDPAGRLMVADRGNSRVRSIIPGNSVQTTAGNGLFRATPDGTPATRAYLFQPSGVALNLPGTLFIADTNNNLVRKIAAGGLIQTVAGVGVSAHGPDGAQATSAGIAFPHGLAVAPNGDLAIADFGNHQIQRITADGTIHAIAGNGNQGFSGDTMPATRAMLNQPNAIAFDAAGSLYIADESNNRVRKVSNNVINTFAGNGSSASGGDGQPAAAAGLATPTGVAVDAGGSVYIADYFGYRIRKVSADGRISTFAGTGRPGSDGDGGPALSANIGSPYQLAFDPQGNLYFSEVPGKVRRVAPNGIITTVAGNGQAGFYGDGGPATAAALNVPNGIAVGADGTLYIADVMNNRIRAVLAASPVVSASAAALSFDVSSGGTPSPQQTITLASSLQGAPFNGVPFSITANTASGGNWLQVSSATGATPAVAGITVDPATLVPGTYQGTAVINAPGANPPQITVRVTANVVSAAPPKIGAALAQLNFLTLAGGASSSKTLPVSNAGGGVLNATVAAQGGDWLTVAPGSGNIAPASPLSAIITANPASLAAGTYSGAVVITSDLEQISLPVVMTVTRAQPVLLLSQTGLSFVTVQGGSSPLPQTVGIINTGQGPMNWTAKASTLSGGPWLSLGTASGTVTQPNLDVSSIAVSVNTAGMGAGTYYGQIQVTVPDADNSPRFVTVVLNVLAPGRTVGPDIQPSGLIFVGTAGSTPGSQEILISNPTSTPLTFASSVTTVPAGGAWLTYLPTGATLNPGQPLKMVVQANMTNLAAGAQQATISFQFSDGSIRSVNILNLVAPSGSNAARAKGGERLAGNCSPQGLNLQAGAPADQFSAALLQPVTLQIRIADTCGNAVTSGSVSARFSSGDDPVYLVHVGSGSWTGTWSPKNPGQAQGQVQIVVTAIGRAAGQQVDYGGQTRLNGTLRSGAGPPLTFRFANAASGTSTFISPGGQVSIFGAQLATQQGSIDAGPFPTQINGTQVLLGGRALPLRYVADDQVNAQIPFELTSTTTHQLVVQRGSTLSTPQEIPVSAAEPAIYTQDATGKGAGVIRNQSRGGALVTPATPASAGDSVVIFCNGLGAVDPPVPSGTLAPIDGPMSQTLAPLNLTIGGIRADVSFAGLSPGTSDLYQVNAVIPDGAGTGDNVPVVISIAGQTSPPVSMSLQ